MTEKFCNYCLSCEFDCKRRTNTNECVNYSKAIDLDEYREIIRELNVNIRRLCKENNLKYHIMLAMLKGKQVFKFKYRKILESHIYEKECYLPYVEDCEVDN